jgi:hypothetical protein
VVIDVQAGYISHIAKGIYTQEMHQAAGTLAAMQEQFQQASKQ